MGNLTGALGVRRNVAQGSFRKSRGLSQILGRLKYRKPRSAGLALRPAAVARERLALAKGVETKKSKFAKRTWNVPWNQQFHFWRLTSASQTGRHGKLAGDAYVAAFAMCVRQRLIVR